MEYSCNICNKKYVSYKSLWNHNNKYHRNNVVINLPELENNVVINSPENKVLDNRTCKYCKKKLCDRKYRWKHEQNCKKIEIENKTEIEEIKNKNAKMEKEIAEYKAEMEKLKDIIQKSLKIHPQTLKKINNQLNNNTNNTNNGTINNNNITYVQLGSEDLVNVLSKSEKRGILNRKAMGINDLVELVHCSGKYKEFMNVYITNLQNTVAYRYDRKTNNFIVINKNELIDEIIDARIYDITKFLEEAEKVLEPNTAADIKRIINKMGKDNSFKGLKKEEIKFILYNNKEKISSQKEKLIDNEFVV